MGRVTVNDILVTPLKRISVDGGDVLYGMKSVDQGFSGFGEGYFSFIEYDIVKAWKRHTKMTLNLIVPIGQVRFVFIDDFDGLYEITIGQYNYARLTVPPGLWFGFHGIGSLNNLLLNIANIEHDPNEVERKKLEEISFNWKE